MIEKTSEEKISLRDLEAKLSEHSKWRILKEKLKIVNALVQIKNVNFSNLISAKTI